MISHEEKMELREHLYKHSMVLMEKIGKMIQSGDLTKEQMLFASDVMKDVSSVDKNLSKACFYDSRHDIDEDKKY